MKELQIHIHVSPDTFLKDPSVSVLGRRIVDSSIKMIDELGFESFTFQKLGKTIGSPESSIYRYFENKHLLLVYLTYWYWCWIEYKMVFAITNIEYPKLRLERAIDIITSQLKEDNSYPYINKAALDRIIVKEAVKTFHVKQVKEENQRGYFEVYKRIVQRISDIILELNPSFEYPRALVSTIIEGAHQQRFFAEHLPSLTDVENGDKNISAFYTKMAKTILQK